MQEITKLTVLWPSTSSDALVEYAKIMARLTLPAAEPNPLLAVDTVEPPY